MKLEALTLPDNEEVISLDMVDLDRVVFITGISEVGGWGSSRTIWEVEAYREFSVEVYIGVAYIM